MNEILVAVCSFDESGHQKIFFHVLLLARKAYFALFERKMVLVMDPINLFLMTINIAEET